MHHLDKYRKSGFKLFNLIKNLLKSMEFSVENEYFISKIN